MLPPRLAWLKLNARHGGEAALETWFAEQREAISTDAPGTTLQLLVDRANPTLYFAPAAGEAAAGVAEHLRGLAVQRDLLQDRPRLAHLERAIHFAPRDPAADLPPGAIVRVGRHRTMPELTDYSVEAYRDYLTAQMADPTSGFLASAMYRQADDAAVLHFFTWAVSWEAMRRHAEGAILRRVRELLNATLRDRLEIWNLEPVGRPVAVAQARN